MIWDKEPVPRPKEGKWDKKPVPLSQQDDLGLWTYFPYSWNKIP